MIKLFLSIILFCGFLMGCDKDDHIILTDENTHALYMCVGSQDGRLFCDKVDSPSTSAERK